MKYLHIFSINRHFKGVNKKHYGKNVFYKIYSGFSFIGKGVDHNGYDFLFSRDS